MDRLEHALRVCRQPGCAHAHVGVPQRRECWHRFHAQVVGGGHVVGEAAVPDQSAVLDFVAHGIRPGAVVAVFAGMRVEALES
ncbi:MAG: hypothetical protein OXG33_04315 [Chloroflexi bacterium]|nr:hypothetical protein [Chloroflexota bacterium]